MRSRTLVEYPSEKLSPLFLGAVLGKTGTVDPFSKVSPGVVIVESSLLLSIVLILSKSHLSIGS